MHWATHNAIQSIMGIPCHNFKQCKIKLRAKALVHFILTSHTNCYEDFIKCKIKIKCTHFLDAKNTPKN